MIDGVRLIPLKQILDERGKVMHMLRADAAHFSKFGEIYFSTTNFGAIKAWHKHLQMTLNYAVPFGNIKCVLYDDRQDSITKGEIQEIYLGPDNYQLLVIPPGIWNGFKGISTEPAIVANCADIPHAADEIIRLPYDSNEIPYEWGIRHR